MNTRRLLTPSQLNALARSLLEDSFPLVEVEGELGGISRPASGHLYFALKDRSAQVRCAMFRPKSHWLKFRPAEGDRVIARGRVTLYEPRGEYQLVVEHLEPAGSGDLQRAFEELKRRLEAEGLFAAERKQPIPRWIGRLGVLSSPGGAAIHDVLSVLRRRFPLVEVELLPVPVQGSGAAAQIVAMLARADRSARYDALLLTRGGGSLEDLAAFNDEALARAIAACTTPVVAAIGHEIDFAIAEFVADLRAPTPSAAGEALSPDGRELRRHLQALHERLRVRLRRRREIDGQRLDQLLARLQAQRPQAHLRRQRDRLHDLAVRLRQVPNNALALRRARAGQLRERLAVSHPQRLLQLRRQRSLELRQRLQATLARRLERRALQLSGLVRAFNAVGPLATLGRGYAILQDRDGRVVSSVHSLRAGDALGARLVDGRLDLSVERVHADSEPAPDDSR